MKRKKSKKRQPTKTTAELITDSLEKFRSLLEEGEFVQLQEAIKRPLYPALRMNPLKVDSQAKIQALADRYGWVLKKIPYCDTGWWVTDARVPISQTIEHRMGEYYIQDAASMLPVELFDLEEKESPLILDMAASPGGKTTHLISKTRDKGLVIANDASRDRITALRLVLQTWGGLHVGVTRFPGEKFGRWFPETFDYVLLDAPCSMQNLRGTESHQMRFITEKEQKQLARRQTSLLESAIQALKVGGQVVYSTCTLSPEEDEAVLDTLLKKYPEAIQMESLENRLPSPAPALVEYGGRQFHPSVVKAARLWPHRFDTSGFFCAMIRKTAPAAAPTAPPPEGSFDKIELYRLTGREYSKLRDFLFQYYEFDLDKILDLYEITLWQRKEKIYAVPDAYLQRFGQMPFQALGLLLGECTGEGYQLAHEWVSRFGYELKGRHYHIPEEYLQNWLHGEDINVDLSSQFNRGMTVIVEDQIGRVLGQGRVLSDRLKNLLPRRSVLS